MMPVTIQRPPGVNIGVNNPGSTIYIGNIIAGQPANADTDGTIRLLVATDSAPRCQIRIGGVFTETGFNFRPIGDLLAGVNTVPTVISAQNVFVDLVLGTIGSAAVVGTGNNLFTLVDDVTGEMRYDNLNPKTVFVAGAISASASGGGQRYNFRALINGAPLSPPDDIAMPVEIGKDLVTFPLIWGITLNQNDTFRIQVENASGMKNLTIDTLKVTIA